MSQPDDSALQRFLKREQAKARRSIPLARPQTRVIKSSDAVEKVSLGVYENGIVFLTLLTRDETGRYKPVKHWRRDLSPANAMNVASGLSRRFLAERERQRAKEFKLRSR